ncbi:MAG: TlpA family protein disulfide reductase [Armatimonadetes bacterium]|nr:TlpA family protein disulfide reductase [Armatimonadota bacterium]
MWSRGGSKLKKFFLILTLLATATFALAQSNVPEIGIKDTKGKLWTLKSLEKDKIYFFEFWATWCGTCREIEPILNDFRKEQKSLGYQFVSVSIDENLADLAKYVKTKTIDYPLLVDSRLEMADRWKVKEVPTMVIVKNGKVLWRKTGKVTLDELRKAVKEAK